MTIKKIPSLIALSICLELILSPLPAVAQGVPSGQQVMDGMNFGLDIYNRVRGGNQGQSQMPPYVATDMAALQKQQTPTPDKYFTFQNMQKIPGLMEYIAVQNQRAAGSGGKPINPASLNCQTLPTTLHEANNEVCRNEKISDFAGDPKVQRDEAFAYYNQYLQIDKLYRNYSASSNSEGQAFGVGCMNNSMEVLKGFFAYRVEQLDTVMANLEKATADFKEQSEMDLKAIRESSAILNGEDSNFAGEFKGSNIFDYGARLGDPACNSILSKDGLDQLGKDGGGLLGIDKKLKADYATPVPPSNYTAEQFIQKNADIQADIRKMADKVSEQANLNFGSITGEKDGYSKFLQGLGQDVSSEHGATAALNKSFFSDVQAKFNKSMNNLDVEAKLLNSELGGKGGNAFNLLSKVDNSEIFDAEIVSLENQIKGECVNRSGIDTALARIYDPNLSKEANKHSAAQVQKRIKAIIADVALSPEKKMAELQAIESQNSNRYEMKMDANYETQELGQDGKLVKKTVNAASKVTPGSYFADVIKNCDTQFQVNKLNNKLSGKETIQRFRGLKKDYEKVARQTSKDLKDEIVKKMIDCNGNGAVAASSAVGSCSPDSLNMSKPGFCAKAAFSCSKNMSQCSAKAAGFVKKLKDDRTMRTNNFNNNVEANRKQLVGMFDTALSKYVKEAESLRGMFGAGFKAPTNIERDLKTPNQFDTDYGGDKGDEFQIKDPSKYLEMVKKNIVSLQDAVKQQQDAIIGDGGSLAKHIDSTGKNYDKVLNGDKGDGASRLAAKCLAAYNDYETKMKQQQTAANETQKKNAEMNGEMGEKNGELCGVYADIMSDNPNDSCKENIRDLANSAITASGKAGQPGNKSKIDQMVKDMKARCANLPVEMKDAVSICAAEPKNLADIFIGKYKGNVSGPNLTEACTEIQSEKSYGYCEIKEIHSREIKKVSKDEWNAIKPNEVENNLKCTWSRGSEPNVELIGNCKRNEKDCKKIQDQIVAIYESARQSGKLGSSTQANPMPDLCSSSDNSGRDNPKSNLPGPGTNPVDQNNGGNRGQGT